MKYFGSGGVSANTSSSTVRRDSSGNTNIGNVYYAEFTATGTSFTLDPANGHSQVLTVSGNFTITAPTSPSTGSEREVLLEIKQNGTGGYTATFSGFTYASGTAPVINTIAGQSTFLFLRGNNVGGWYIFAANTSLGVTDASSASTGIIGEYLSSTIALGSATSLTSNTAKDITTLTLSPGDWKPWGTIAIIPAGTTTLSSFVGSVNTTSGVQATSPAGGSMFTLNLPVTTGFTTGATQMLPTGQSRQNVSVTTVIYLVVTVVFNISTCTGYGFLAARRMR